MDAARKVLILTLVLCLASLSTSAVVPETAALEEPAPRPAKESGDLESSESAFYYGYGYPYYYGYGYPYYGYPYYGYPYYHPYPVVYGK